MVALQFPRCKMSIGKICTVERKLQFYIYLSTGWKPWKASTGFNGRLSMLKKIYSLCTVRRWPKDIMSTSYNTKAIMDAFRFSASYSHFAAVMLCNDLLQQRALRSLTEDVQSLLKCRNCFDTELKRRQLSNALHFLFGKSARLTVRRHTSLRVGRFTLPCSNDRNAQQYGKAIFFESKALQMLPQRCENWTSSHVSGA